MSFLKFVEFKENIYLNGVEIKAGVSVPVLLDEDKNIKDDGVEIQKKCIINGMMEALKTKVKAEDALFYKKVLLSDKTLLERLRSTSIIKGGSSNFKDALLNIDILLSILVLDESEISYINLVRGLINAIHLCEDEGDIDTLDNRLFDILNEGLNHYPESYSLLFHMADYYKNQHNYELAKKYVNLIKGESGEKESVNILKKEVEKLEQTESEILFIYDLISMNSIDKAIEKANEFLKKDSNNWYVLMLLGWSYRIKGEFEKARENLIKCIGCGGGDFAEAYNELSLAEWEIGDKELAVTYQDSACDLGENNISFYCNAALMYLELGELDKAHERLFQAAEIDRDDEILKDSIEAYNKHSKEKFVYPKEAKEKFKNSEYAKQCLKEGKKNDKV